MSHAEFGVCWNDFSSKIDSKSNVVRRIIENPAVIADKTKIDFSFHSLIAKLIMLFLKIFARKMDFLHVNVAISN